MDGTIKAVAAVVLIVAGTAWANHDLTSGRLEDEAGRRYRFRAMLPELLIVVGGFLVAGVHWHSRWLKWAVLAGVPFVGTLVVCWAVRVLGRSRDGRSDGADQGNGTD